MKLQFKVFGVEVASWELALDQVEEIAAHPVVVQTEKKLRRLVGRGIGRMSTTWVALGMRS